MLTKRSDRGKLGPTLSEPGAGLGRGNPSRCLSSSLLTEFGRGPGDRLFFVYDKCVRWLVQHETHDPARWHDGRPARRRLPSGMQRKAGGGAGRSPCNSDQQMQGLSASGFTGRSVLLRANRTVSRRRMRPAGPPVSTLRPRGLLLGRHRGAPGRDCGVHLAAGGQGQTSTLPQHTGAVSAVVGRFRHRRKAGSPRSTEPPRLIRSRESRSPLHVRDRIQCRDLTPVRSKRSAWTRVITCIRPGHHRALSNGFRLRFDRHHRKGSAAVQLLFAAHLKGVATSMRVALPPRDSDERGTGRCASGVDPWQTAVSTGLFAISSTPSLRPGVRRPPKREGRGEQRRFSV